MFGIHNVSSRKARRADAAITQWTRFAFFSLRSTAIAAPAMSISKASWHRKTGAFLPPGDAHLPPLTKTSRSGSTAENIERAFEVARDYLYERHPRSEVTVQAVQRISHEFAVDWENAKTEFSQ